MTESTPTAKEQQEVENPRPGVFIRYIYSVFFWCMSGVAVIYGVRIYHNVPIHPSFVPIIGAVFAAILSFTLVMTFKIVAGPINIRTGSFKLEGASGPIALWCFAFLAVCYGLYLLGLPEAAKANVSTEFDTRSVGDLVLGKSPRK